MAQEQLKNWERLFAQAMQVIDAAQRAERHSIVWTLGGGSALMRRHRHRRSAGVDLFVRDVRMLHGLPPRPIENNAGPALDYVQEPASVRIYFPDGEVAFIASGLHVSDPVRREWILGRPVLVETSPEILAKKLERGAASFSARDLFDFAVIAALEPNAIREVRGLLRSHRGGLLARLREHGPTLREDFAALDSWQLHPTFEECVAALRTALYQQMPPPVLEQERRPYLIMHRDSGRSPRTTVKRVLHYGVVHLGRSREWHAETGTPRAAQNDGLRNRGKLLL